mgnify:CR=1 FL=1
MSTKLIILTSETCFSLLRLLSLTTSFFIFILHIICVSIYCLHILVRKTNESENSESYT